MFRGLIVLCVLLSAAQTFALASTRLTPHAPAPPIMRQSNLINDAVARANELQTDDLGYGPHVTPRITVLGSSLRSQQSAREAGMIGKHIKAQTIQAVTIQLSEPDGVIWRVTYFYDPQTHLLQSENVKQTTAPLGAKRHIKNR